MSDQLDFDFSNSGSDSSSRAETEAASAGNRRRKEKARGPEQEKDLGQADLFEQANADDDGDTTEAGFERWKASQRERLQVFATRLGLPLGREVELTLHSGTVLHGRLRLSASGNTRIPSGANDRQLRNHLNLEINRADFTAADIASCVRVDS